MILLCNHVLLYVVLSLARPQPPDSVLITTSSSAALSGQDPGTGAVYRGLFPDQGKNSSGIVPIVLA